MWQRFTADARASMLYGQEAAQALHSDYVGPEHILLGLLKDESCAAARIVTQLGPEPQTVRGTILLKCTPGTPAAGAEPKLTAPAKRLLELSAAEARRARHAEINSGHVLLGLLRLGEENRSWFGQRKDTSNLALQVLAVFDITLERVRELVGEHLDEETERPNDQPEPQPSTGPWQRFTERARRAVLYAQEEAEKAGSQVAPEYLLLGVLREKEGVGAIVLNQLGVDINKLRAQMPPVTHTGIEPKLTPAGKQVLERAAAETKHFRHDYIGTEHLLLALRHDATVAELLHNLGVDTEDLSTRVQNFLGPEPPHP